MGIFSKIFAKLKKNKPQQLGFSSQVRAVSGLADIFLNLENLTYPDFIEQLEEVLIMADFGVQTTLKVLETFQKSVTHKNFLKIDETKEKLLEAIYSVYENQSVDVDNSLAKENPLTAYMFVGVNGSGKTTTIAKLAARLKKQGKKVLLIAADTFRAGAVDQLVEWGKRLDIDVFSNPSTKDAGSVCFDGLEKAIKEEYTFCLIDTAGRLQNKQNLMAELAKIKKIVVKKLGKELSETILVVDANLGQNSFEQAKSFKEITDISALALAKMDGTAKGGIIFRIKNELGIPTKLIGVGEKENDLLDFELERYMSVVFQELFSNETAC